MADRAYTGAALRERLERSSASAAYAARSAALPASSSFLPVASDASDGLPALGSGSRRYSPLASTAAELSRPSSRGTAGVPAVPSRIPTLTRGGTSSGAGSRAGVPAGASAIDSSPAGATPPVVAGTGGRNSIGAYRASLTTGATTTTAAGLPLQQSRSAGAAPPGYASSAATSSGSSLYGGVARPLAYATSGATAAPATSGGASSAAYGSSYRDSDADAAYRRPAGGYGYGYDHDGTAPRGSQYASGGGGGAAAAAAAAAAGSYGYGASVAGGSGYTAAYAASRTAAGASAVASGSVASSSAARAPPGAYAYDAAAAAPTGGIALQRSISAPGSAAAAAPAASASGASTSSSSQAASTSSRLPRPAAAARAGSASSRSVESTGSDRGSGVDELFGPTSATGKTTGKSAGAFGYGYDERRATAGGASASAGGTGSRGSSRGASASRHRDASATGSADAEGAAAVRRQALAAASAPVPRSAAVAAASSSSSSLRREALPVQHSPMVPYSSTGGARAGGGSAGRYSGGDDGDDGDGAFEPEAFPPSSTRAASGGTTMSLLRGTAGGAGAMPVPRASASSHVGVSSASSYYSGGGYGSGYGSGYATGYGSGSSGSGGGSRYDSASGSSSSSSKYGSSADEYDRRDYYGDAYARSTGKSGTSSASSASSSLTYGSASTATAASSSSTATASPYAASPRGLCGLANMGNTCFMNSTLQCLSNTPLLCALLTGDVAALAASPVYARSPLASAASGGLRVNRHSPTRGEAVAALSDLFQRMWKARHHATGGIERPSRVKSVVGTVASRFLGYDQQDAQEFLRFFVDALHDDTNAVTGKLPYRQLEESPTQSDAEVCRDWWRYYCERNDSVIKTLFCGQLKTTVTCGTCGHVSRAFDPFWDLQLPIPRAAQLRGKTGGAPPPEPSPSLSGSGGWLASGISSLLGRPSSAAATASASASSASAHGGAFAAACAVEDCLASFAQPEELSGSESAYCSKCKKHRPGTKSTVVFRLPDVLVLQLKRFTFSTFRRTKLNTEVAFPTRGLDMQRFCAPSSPFLLTSGGGGDASEGTGSGGTGTGDEYAYDLWGVVNHMGGLGGGHYTADCLNRDDGRWYNFNDSSVSPTSAGRLSKSAAYLLFYVRRRAFPAPGVTLRTGGGSGGGGGTYDGDDDE